MTTIIQCVMNNGMIEILEKVKLEKFKKKLHQGAPLSMIIDDGEGNGGSLLFRKFHALRDDYAAILNYSSDYAKAELKHLYGTCIPWTADFTPPIRGGRFVEMYGTVEFQISTREYTSEELQRIVQGTMRSIDEAKI